MASGLVIQLSILLAISFIVNADVHDEFPQWDRINWLVESDDNINLTCSHQYYYPFNNLTVSAVKIVWILPRDLGYLHLAPGERIEGWHAMNQSGYPLMIKKSEVYVPEKVNGMYVCAALAKVDASVDGIYAWYYLRWGVGLYLNVPAMNKGSIAQK